MGAENILLQIYKWDAAVQSMIDRVILLYSSLSLPSRGKDNDSSSAISGARRSYKETVQSLLFPGETDSVKTRRTRLIMALIVAWSATSLLIFFFRASRGFQRLLRVQLMRRGDQ